MDAKKLLSKNLLQMKFMQRTKEKYDLREEEKKTAHLLSNDFDTTDLATKRGQVLVQPSYVECEQLLFGRMSFKGCNAEIEKLMLEKREVTESPAQTVATESNPNKREMAMRYGKMGISNNSKRGRNSSPSGYHHQRKRTKYIRPVD